MEEGMVGLGLENPHLPGVQESMMLQHSCVYVVHISLDGHILSLIISLFSKRSIGGFFI
jgi:hypothetical protein